MGVDITTYRCRIGTFRHGSGLDVVLIKLCINYIRCMKMVGAVSFVGILLLMAGIEANPGPTGGMATSSSWKEHDNVFRCSKLLVEGGGKLAKELLLQEGVSKCGYKNINDFLADTNNKTKITSLKPRVIKESQYEILYPKNNSVTDLSKWDITLTVFVLTNCVALNQAQKVAVVDIRTLRNTIYGHTSSMAMTETDFQKTWTDITSTLRGVSKLLSSQCQQQFEDMILLVEKETLSADKAIETLMAWHDWENKTESTLTEIKTGLSNVGKTLENLEEKQKQEIISVKHVVTEGKHEITNTVQKEVYGLKKRMESLFKKHDKQCSRRRKFEMDTQMSHFRRIEQRVTAFESRMETSRIQTVNQQKLNSKTELARVQLEDHKNELRRLNITYETRLSKQVKDQLQNTHIIVLSGVSGIGKTYLALNLVNHMLDSSPYLRPIILCEPRVNEVVEIIDTSNLYILLMDDFLGKFNIDMTILADWNRFVDTLEALINTKKIFVVITIRNVIKNKCRHEQTNKLFKVNWVVDLNEHVLNNEEKRNMIKIYANRNGVQIPKSDVDKAIKNTSHGIGFPLLCRIMKGNDIVSLFANPVEVIKEHLLTISEKETVNFVSLIMPIFFNEKLHNSTFTEESTCFQKIQQHYKNKTINKLSILKGAEEMLHTYLSYNSRENCFTFAHDTILESTFEAAKECIPEILIEYCPIETLIKFGQCCILNMSTRNMLVNRLRKTISTTSSTHVLQQIAGCAVWKNDEFVKIAFQEMEVTDFYREDGTGNSLIVYLAGLGYISALKHADSKTKAYPKGVTTEYRQRHISKAIMQACLNRKLEVISYLVERFQMNASTEIMFAAVKGGSRDIVELLLSKGGNIQAIRDESGENLFHEACLHDNIQVIMCLLQKLDEQLKHEMLNAKTNTSHEIPLMIASKHCSLETFILLYGNGSNILSKDNSGSTHLHNAALKGNLKIVEYICKSFPLLIQVGDKNQCNSAHKAAEGGSLECLRYLIEVGVDPMSMDNDGRTCLHLASMKGSINVAKYLCENYKEMITITDNDKLTSVHYAAQAGSLECLIYLIEQGVDPMNRANDGRTCLHSASRNGRIDVVKYLCENYKEMITITDNDKWTSVQYAAQGGSVECLIYLKEQGVDPMSRANDGRTCLHSASLTGRINVVKYLCENYKEMITITDNDKRTSIQYAAQGGSVECLIYLIEQGVDPMSRAYDGRTCLHAASLTGRINVVKYLCENYKEMITITDNDKWTSVQYAAQGGSVECLIYLIEEGVDPMSRANDGHTCLHSASLTGRINDVKYLCENYKEMITITNNNKWTSVHYAAEGGSLECLIYLIEQGVDPMSRANDGRTCLHSASLTGRINVVKYLCEKYKEMITITDNNKWTSVHYAAQGGSVECLIYLVDQGVDPMSRANDGRTCLHSASRNGSINVVKYLCENYKEMITITDNDKWTSVHYAARGGSVECLIYLIEQGVDPMSRANGSTCLHSASMKGNIDVVKYLCENYKEMITITDNDKWTSVHYAADGGSVECLIYLIEQGVDPMSRGDGSTCLHSASMNGSIDVVKYLCENYKEMITITDKNKWTSAQYAANGGSLECLIYLVDQGVDPMSRGNDGSTCLHSASMKGSIDVVKYLCENYKEMITITDNYKWTSVHYAAEGGSVECLIYLIEQGVDPMSRANDGSTCLHLASMKGSIDVVKYLCENYNEMITITDKNKWTSVHYAADGGSLECLIYLIDQGVDPMSRTNAGRTCLHLASRKGSIEVVKYLCENYKEMITITDNYKWTSVHYAADVGLVECLIYLIDQGADPMSRTNDGSTCLHLASRNGSIDVVKYLCENYKEMITITDKNKWTSVHYAADGGSLECLIYLIEQGVDPMSRTNDGSTCLHLASMNGSIDVVKYLCENYKDMITITDKNKWTSVHYTAEGGSVECLIYLIDQGVDPMSRANAGRTCLHLASRKGSIDVVKYLCGNHKELIPMTDNDNLTAAYYASRQDELTKAKDICKKLKQKCWVVNAIPVRKNSKGTLLIVCYTTGNIKVDEQLDIYNGVKVIYQDFMSCSNESLAAEQSLMAQQANISRTWTVTANSAVSKYTDDLMTKHSNLEMIGISAIRSTAQGYKPEPCIVLYCRSKAYVPADEELFPKELKAPNETIINTDVREGFFKLCAKVGNLITERSCEWRQELSIGHCIGPADENVRGTLGMFVTVHDQQPYTAFLTASHLFFKSPDDPHPTQGTIQVIQPANGVEQTLQLAQNRNCGTLMTYIFDCNGEVGIDVALVKIAKERMPTRPTFADVYDVSLDEAGFSPDDFPTFDDGSTQKATDFTVCKFAADRVIKFGATTGLTKGVFRLRLKAVRITCKDSKPLRMDSCNRQFVMKGQLEIDSHIENLFFQKGDSGSAVFHVDNDNKLFCIGMAIGIATDSLTIVTPIHPIIDRLSSKLGARVTVKRFLTDNEMDT